MDKVKEALKHPDATGEGAKKRKKVLNNEQDYWRAIMEEYKRGTLHSGSGAVVKSPAQAKLIALKEIQKKFRKR